MELRFPFATRYFSIINLQYFDFIFLERQENFNYILRYKNYPHPRTFKFLQINLPEWNFTSWTAEMQINLTSSYFVGEKLNIDIDRWKSTWNLYQIPIPVQRLTINFHSVSESSRAFLILCYIPLAKTTKWVNWCYIWQSFSSYHTPKTLCRFSTIIHGAPGDVEKIGAEIMKLENCVVTR